ncbi:MAG TPA: hypothetical protein PKL45_15375 [Bacteroidia bacterium]|nr:hypothetical protein [Bacteroidia bacterium]
MSTEKSINESKGNAVLPLVSTRLSENKNKTEYVKPIKTPDWWNDLYTDACGNCYSDADSGL